MGNKWFSQRKCSQNATTIRPKQAPLCNYFQYIVIIIQLYLVICGTFATVLADTGGGEGGRGGITSTWAPVTSKYGPPSNNTSHFEHIYLRDITKSVNSSGK